MEYACHFGDISRVPFGEGNLVNSVRQNQGDCWYKEHKVCRNPGSYQTRRTGGLTRLLSPMIFERVAGVDLICTCHTSPAQLGFRHR